MRKIEIKASGNPLAGAHDLIWRHLGWVYPKEVVIVDTWAKNSVIRIEHHGSCGSEALLSLNTQGDWCALFRESNIWTGLCPKRGVNPRFMVDLNYERPLETRGLSYGLSPRILTHITEVNQTHFWSGIFYGDTLKRHLRQDGRTLYNFRAGSQIPSSLGPKGDVHPLGISEVEATSTGRRLYWGVGNHKAASSWRTIGKDYTWTRLGGVLVSGEFYMSIFPWTDNMDPMGTGTWCQVYREEKQETESYAFEDSQGRVWSASEGCLNVREDWI